MLWLFWACQVGTAVIDKHADTEESITQECDIEGSLSLSEEISWFYWGGTEPPVASFSPEILIESCGDFVASTTEDWLVVNMAVDGSSLEVSIDPTKIQSGNHQTTIEIYDDGFNETIVEIPVTVSALVSPLSTDAIHRRGLVIGVDGLDGAEMHTANTPYIDLLQQGGSWTRQAQTQLTGATSSGPGWTSILTGVEVEDHEITYNGGYSDRNTQYPSFLNKLKLEGYQTAAAIQWEDIFSILEQDALDSSSGGDQQEVTDWMVNRIGDFEDDVYFIHLDDVDHAGHASGYSAESEYYVEMIEEADRNIGELLQAIVNGSNVQNEEWIILLTSDHGGDTSGTHGSIGWDYQQIPLIVAGSLIQKQEIPVGYGSQLDIHPTVLDFFGMDPMIGGLDGLSWFQKHEFDCTDGADNDSDGNIDCEDSDCETSVDCQELDCSNGIDDDLDGDIDCEDSDCEDNIACFECNPTDLGYEIGVEVISGISPNTNFFAGSCGGGDGNESVFTWTAPTTETYILDTMEWYRDTVLYVYNDVCGGEEMACNERPSTSERSVVSVDMVEDQMVTIIIDTDGFDETTTGLSIYPKSDSCDNMEQNVDSWTETFTHQDLSFVGSCVPAISPTWWEWTAPNDGTYYIDTVGSDFDTVLYILDGCEGEELACNDDDGSLLAGQMIELIQNQSIIIGVGSFAGRTTSGTVGVHISN